MGLKPTKCSLTPEGPKVGVKFWGGAEGVWKRSRVVSSPMGSPNAKRFSYIKVLRMAYILMNSVWGLTVNLEELTTPLPEAHAWSRT